MREKVAVVRMLLPQGGLRRRECFAVVILRFIHAAHLHQQIGQPRTGAGREKAVLTILVHQHGQIPGIHGLSLGKAAVVLE